MDSYLIFRQNNLLYGIPISIVKEIFQLPEITPIPEAPPDIIGILNYRDVILPIMHLNRRLGLPMGKCNVRDSVIVIESQMIQMGIIVHQVLDVRTIPQNFVEPEPDYGRENHINTAFISGIAKIANDNIILLNNDALIRSPDELETVMLNTQLEKLSHSEEISLDKIPASFYELYAPHITEEDKAIFRKRSAELQKHRQDLTEEYISPLALFILGDDHFALDLENVREFVTIDRVYPIPCCPDRILGNFNLRGQIITLCDLRPILHLETEDLDEEIQAIVIEINDIKLGILVEEIVDVLYLSKDRLFPIPAAVASDIKPYIKGTASYEDIMFTRIDLVNIIAEDILVVDLRV